ncbi:cytochrome P450 [Biscogniauxia mediterranea]|nr:cytochrome P450 [Biscogniauxia mediterranea]
MPHSFLLGHLWTTAKIAIKHKFPPDANSQWMFHFIKMEYPEIASAGLVYMDPWPISYPTIAVYHPDMMNQFVQDNVLPKYYAMGQREFKHFTGGKDILNLEGQEWKMARSMFNPGFSVKNLLSLIPDFVEETLVFRQRLKQAAASGEVIKLEDYTIDATVDVVSRAVLGVRLQHQTKPHRLVTAMQSAVQLIYFNLDIAKQLSPTRHIKIWMYNRMMRQELMPLIENTVRNYEKIEGPKTILALALKSYVSEVQDASERSIGMIPRDFIERIIQHIKIFMFAGHDTTATTLASCFYFLSQHPDKLAKLRAEHDEVLGPDPAAAAALISADPALLNRLPYTLGAIKETLRLASPVGGTIRQSPPGHFLAHPATGARYPTHGFMIHSSAVTLARAPEYWHEADRFEPGRFLVRDNEADPWYPPRGAWRMFEAGPRNCIGQELSTLEMRLVLALTAREFDVEDAYPPAAPEWLGGRAYQCFSAKYSVTAHIKDGLPVRIRERKAGKSAE